MIIAIVIVAVVILIGLFAFTFKKSKQKTITQMIQDGNIHITEFDDNPRENELIELKEKVENEISVEDKKFS